MPSAATLTLLLVSLLVAYAPGADVPGGGDAMALRRLVDALPVATVAEGAKRAVLTVALERSERLRADGRNDEAGELIGDVRTALERPAVSLAARSPTAEQIGALFPVRVTTGNPYLDWLRAGLGDELKRRDEFLEPDAYARNAFSDDPGSANGTLALTCEAMFWCYVNPASPFAGDGEVLARFLRRAFFYVDGVDRLAGIVLTRKRGFIDEFSLGPALAPLREFAELLPDLLLPSQRRQWDAALRHVAQAQLQDFGRFDGSYPNIDVTRGFQLFNLGRYLHDQDLLDKAKTIIEVQRKNIYADGGIAYIGQQNAQQGYQYTVAVYLARYYEATRDPAVLTMLASAQWYGPVCGRFPEWWTASAWKGMWNSPIQDIGGEFCACVSGNPYLFGMRGAPTLADMVIRKWRNARAAVAWYRDDVAAKALPDHYVAIDRNIVGPRAYHDGFMYAASLRDIAIGPGLGTVMGCLFQGEAGPRSIVPRIAPEVQVADAAGKLTPAWITAGLTGAMSIGRHFSVVTASYAPATNKNSSKGLVLPWVVHQIWLGLPDRIVGLLTIAPEQDHVEADGVDTLVRCGVGGPKDQVTRVAAGEYRYQGLTIIVHEHNYRNIALVDTPARSAESFSTDLVLHAGAGGPATGERTTFLRANPFYLVVEIKPTSAAGAATTRRLPTGQDGLVGFAVTAAGKDYTIWLNQTDHPVTATLAGGPASCLHASGAPPVAPAVPAPASVVVPPHQHIVEVVSQDPVDRLPGWPSFQEMVERGGTP